MTRTRSTPTKAQTLTLQGMKRDKFTMGETVRLWLALNRGVAKVPYKATASNNKMAYIGDTLFFEGNVVARAFAKKNTKRTKRVVVYYNFMVEHRGWRGYTYLDALLHEVAIEEDGLFFRAELRHNVGKPTLKEINTAFWGSPWSNSYNHETLNILKVGEFFGYKRAQIMAAPKVKFDKQMTRRTRHTFVEHADRHVALILHRVSPEGIAEAKRQRAADALREKRDSNFRFAYNEVYYSWRRIDDDLQNFIRSGRVPIAMQLGVLGIKPDGLYKRLLTSPGHPEGLKARSGPWPAVGVWTADVEPRLCHSGWHVTEGRSLNRWSEWGEHIYEVEVGGQCGGSDDSKKCYERARLTNYLGALINGNVHEAPDSDFKRALLKKVDNDFPLQRANQKLLEYKMFEAGYSGHFPYDDRFAAERAYLERLVDQSIPLNK